ncbi:MAG: 23S rRNA (adenine(2030)-N(6))-methyltransferase RlmJ [Rhodospirillaceae bacterium]|nr:23S rRNA (adenine(2030)-N(6))-methyltransferase RlmJ [Rhodospirillaceae bacterium]
MLSYQHAYHAGSAADVHKHIALCLLLAHLAKKDKAFSVTDLYAGEGDYSLVGPSAQKTGEYARGIARLWDEDAPPVVNGYMAALRRMNTDGALKRYPGSPALARAFMRENDHLILNELHSGAYPVLERWARRDSRISVHKRDGLEAMTGLIPPKVRRGLVLIDPSYEIKTEYAEIPEKLADAVRKWRQGIYVVWYPVLKESRHRILLDGLKAWAPGDILVCELALTPDTREDGAAVGLRGTGIAVVNPPWQFDEQMTEAGAWLTRKLEAGKHSVKWLKREAA